MEDLEQHLLTHWGREGRMGYAVLQKIVDLTRKHGREKVFQAIEIAAEYNAKNLAYLRGILEPTKKNEKMWADFIAKGEK